MTDISKILADMHTALAGDLVKRIEAGTATAADLGVARQFLKDNGITATPVKGSPLGNLLENLPFSGEDSHVN